MESARQWDRVNNNTQYIIVSRLNFVTSDRFAPRERLQSCLHSFLLAASGAAGAVAGAPDKLIDDHRLAAALHNQIRKKARHYIIILTT